MTQAFAALDLSAPTIATLERRGFAEAFPIQAAVIPDALEGRDILARSRTGSGKTLAFAIPIVELLDRSDACPTALILVPTRELAIQVADEFRELAAAKKLKVALAYGGMSISKQAQACRTAQVLVATPGRLEDLCNRRLVSLDGVEILVLDEADHMLDLGFEPQVSKLVARIRPERQTMLFSATLDGAIGALAQRFTNDPVRHEVESDDDGGQITHRFVPISHGDKTDRLGTMLSEEVASTLVFVRTKHGAARLAERLERFEIQAVALHGDMGQRQRERALERFSSGRASALIATDVAARGIDVEHVARVINFDIPGDDKAFVHRVGRTGRAGRTGTAITFVSPDQRRDMAAMAKRLELAAAYHADMPEAPSSRSGESTRNRRPAARRGGRPQRRSW